MPGTKDYGLSSIKILTGIFLFSAFFVPATALELSDMITDSVSAHPEVKEKIHVYRQIIGDKNIAESGWRPSVDLEASSGLYNTESPATGNNSVDYDSSTIELSVTQNLFNGYDTTHQIEQSKARSNAALYDVYDTADNIALNAIRAYLEVLKQRNLYELALENVKSHEDILAQVRDRNISGVGRRSQLQQTEGRVARAQASLIAQQNNLQDASTQLHQILGRYVDPEVLREPVVPSLPGEDLNSLIDQALNIHPAMQVANNNIQAAQSDHRRSLKSRYPNIDLRLASEYGNDIGGLPGNTDETSLVLNLTYNFYRGGSKNAEQQKKISAIYEQKEFAAKVRRQIINTLRLSWTADNSLSQQLGFLQTHVIKARETVDSYKEEFFIGQRDLIDLLDAENELNSAKNQYTEANYDAFIARYRVYEGLGLLFQATDIEFRLSEGNLKVARLYTDKSDKLPLPGDEDLDLEIDDQDHCDNSLIGLAVNKYGCHEAEVPARIETSVARLNAIPDPGDDQFEIETNGILIISPDQLLVNDSDADSDKLQIVDVSQPEVGRLAFNQNKNLVYRPMEGFIGVDSFNYTVSDDSGAAATAKATVEIKVRDEIIINLSKIQLVNFKFNKAELTDISKTKVEAIIKQIRVAGDIAIEVYTYTDGIGSEAYNLTLSKKRARALKNLLESNGIDSADITAVGMGEKNPIADNSTKAGQAINRRGEFIFKAKTFAQ
jgi:adhesin transport system outer membrane protein